MGQAQRASSQGLGYWPFKCQLEPHIKDQTQAFIDKTYFINDFIKEQCFQQQDFDADSLFIRYWGIIDQLGMGADQRRIDLFQPDRAFWYSGDKLYCLKCDIQLEKNRLRDEFEFKYDDRILNRLMFHYDIPDICWTKSIFNALGNFQSKTRYSEYHNASQKLKWLSGASSLSLCDFPFINFYFYNNQLFCLVNQVFRPFFSDILNEQLQLGSRVCFDRSAKVAWFTELNKQIPIRHFSSQTFSGKIILDCDYRTCTVVSYSADLDRFEYEYPSMLDVPHYWNRSIIHNGRAPNLPVHPSGSLCQTLFDMCDGHTSTLDLIAELFARAAIEDEPSRYVWILSGDSSQLRDFLLFSQHMIMDRYIDNVQYDSIFYRENLRKLLTHGFYGKWGLYEHKDSFSIGRKRKKWMALINGEIIDSIEDELCGEVKVSTPMLAIIGTKNPDEITSGLGSIPHRIIKLKKYSLPEIDPLSGDSLWLKTHFIFHGMRLIYGRAAEQKSSTGTPLKMFVESCCSKGPEFYCDGKLFYDKYSRWLKATYPDLTISGSTKFLNSIADILGVKYETLRKNNNRKTLIGISIDEEKYELALSDTMLEESLFEDFCSYLNSFEKYTPIDPLVSPSGPLVSPPSTTTQQY